jgi:hypothetical protein
VNRSTIELHKWKLENWQAFILFMLFLFAVGSAGDKFSQSDSSSKSTSTTASADVGTHMSCQLWQTNMSKISEQSHAQQNVSAKNLNTYASLSANPDIVRNAQLMTAAFLQQDRMAYLTYATLFVKACQVAGE